MDPYHQLGPGGPGSYSSIAQPNQPAAEPLLLVDQPQQSAASSRFVNCCRCSGDSLATRFVNCINKSENICLRGFLSFSTNLFSESGFCFLLGLVWFGLIPVLAVPQFFTISYSRSYSVYIGVFDWYNNNEFPCMNDLARNFTGGVRYRSMRGMIVIGFILLLVQFIASTARCYYEKKLIFPSVCQNRLISLLSLLTFCCLWAGLALSISLTGSAQTIGPYCSSRFELSGNGRGPILDLFTALVAVHTFNICFVQCSNWVNKAKERMKLETNADQQLSGIEGGRRRGETSGPSSSTQPTAPIIHSSASAPPVNPYYFAAASSPYLYQPPHPQSTSVIPGPQNYQMNQHIPNNPILAPQRQISTGGGPGEGAAY